MIMGMSLLLVTADELQLQWLFCDSSSEGLADVGAGLAAAATDSSQS